MVVTAISARVALQRVHRQGPRSLRHWFDGPYGMAAPFDGKAAFSR